MGTPEFAVPSLEHLIYNRHEVVAVYTQPDQVSGRGRTLTMSPVKRVALSWNLPIVQPINFRKPEVVASLAELRPEVIVVAAFGQLLPQSVLGIPQHGCINVHPSLLPKFRGAAPVAGAILAGTDFTGVSIMLLDKGMDTGPVLSRVQVPVSLSDTTGSLTGKLAQVGARALQEVLPAWVRGELVPQPQNDAEASYTNPIAKEDGRIDWKMSAVEIWRRVRAFSPWPGCYTVWQGKRLRIIEAGVLFPAVAGKAGEVIACEKSAANAAFGVVTGAGVLGILKVQLEGKQIVPAADFLRGQRQFVGSVLASD